MQQLLQDSLAVCRDCQKPALFLTMTANASWQEILENLLPGMFVYFSFINQIETKIHFPYRTTGY